MISILVRNSLIVLGIFGAIGTSVEAQTSAERQIYSVEFDRDSYGRLFLTAAEITTGTIPSSVYLASGTVLSKSMSGPIRMVFEVTNAQDAPVHGLDVIKEVEPGATPFAFEWPTIAAPDGDYRVRVRIMDTELGEEARLEWRVFLRSRGPVEENVQQAHMMVNALRDEQPDLPEFAAQRLRLAMEAMASFPSAHHSLLEADLNAHFAKATVGAVRARLALGVAAPTLPAAVTSDLSGPMRGGIVLDDAASSIDRLTEIGFTFAPFMLNSGSAATNVGTASGIPSVAWIGATEDIAQVPSPDLLARAAALPNVAGVSLWTAPKLGMQGETIQEDFQAYIRGHYADRHALNRAWKEHYFSFDEVNLKPFSENRAYQYDAQAFYRARTTRWVSEQLSIAAAAIKPVEPTLTFTEGILSPGKGRTGLDAESLAAVLSIVPVHTSGPLDDARYAQRFPAAQLVWSTMHAFAPDRPLIALHALDFALDDRLRMNSAAQARTLAFEASIEHVAALALEFPRLTDPVVQAPEAVAGFAQALRDIEREASALRALRDASATIAIILADSSKLLGDGATHLNAFARAYEGCSFSGHKVGVLTERQLAEGRWSDVQVVVMPEVTALNREAFAGLESLIAGGATIVRTEQGPTYDEHGAALGKTLPANAKTLLVRGNGAPYEYLSALDALSARGSLPDIPRVITEDDYPIEGVKTRYAEDASGRYLYILNLRKVPVTCRFSQPIEGATDLISGRTVDFPRPVDPLTPMLLRLANQTETD